MNHDDGLSVTNFSQTWLFIANIEDDGDPRDAGYYEHLEDKIKEIIANNTDEPQELHVSHLQPKLHKHKGIVAQIVIVSLSKYYITSIFTHFYLFL